MSQRLEKPELFPVTAPELFIEYKGVKVWHTYLGKDKDYQNRHLYNFTVDEAVTDVNGSWYNGEKPVIFDWYDLPLADGVRLGQWSKQEAIEYAIRQGYLIQGEIKAPGFSRYVSSPPPEPGSEYDTVGWAKTIAARIADEWEAGSVYKEYPLSHPDRPVLEEVLSEAFTRCPDLAQRLVGTTIIEEDYFEDVLELSALPGKVIFFEMED